MSEEKLYKVVFLNGGKVYELFSRNVTSSGLWGFVEVSGLVFETKEGLVVDPTEEKMRQEFEKRGQCLIRDRKSGEKVTPFPVSPPGRSSS
jgi:hypothetical protein